MGVTRYRRLRPEDADAFRRLRLEALAAEPAAFAESVDEAAAVSVASVSDFLARSGPDGFVVGAFVDERLVGTIGFARATGLKTRHKGRVWGAYVTASVRRQGLGRQLLNQLIDDARELSGLTQLMLSVAVDQAPARALYESAGFRSYGCEQGALQHEGKMIDELLMCLHLAR